MGRDVEGWLGLEDAADDGAERNSTVMAAVAGMGVSEGLESSGYPQHIDI